MANIHQVIRDWKETEGTTISNKTSITVTLLRCSLNYDGKRAGYSQESLAPGVTIKFPPNFLAGVFLPKDVISNWTAKDQEYLNYRLGAREEWEVRQNGKRLILKKITPFTKWLDKTLNKNARR